MSENRRIAKNSLVLYLRLLISTFIGLYVSRIVLLELGAEDFGLFAIIGGLISIMNLLNSSMISTSNRFIAVELGKKDHGNVNRVFNTVLLIHIAFALFLIVIAEIVGVWYIKSHLNIKVEKIPDAIFLLHISVMSAVLGTISIPFQGLITAYEKFTVRALIEIIQTFLNLMFVILLTFYVGNKLRAYSIFIAIISVAASLMYIGYCWYKYKTIVKWYFNSRIDEYREISGFFGWTMLYVLGAIGSKQGGALILNSFFGTTLNAAYGIASKVNEFVFSFVKNLNQAAVPQIMKNFGGDNQQRSLTLIYKLSKFTFFIMLIPALPIVLSIDSILSLWLKEVPEYTKYFVVLMLIHGLISSAESGFDATIDATGKIRKTKIFFNVIMLATLPVLYLLYDYGFPPYTLSAIFIVAELSFLFAQIKILQSLTEFKISEYWSNTILPIIIVLILVIPQYFIHLLFRDKIIDLVLFTIISVFLTAITVYFFGLTKAERSIILNNLQILKNKIYK